MYQFIPKYAGENCILLRCESNEVKKQKNLKNSVKRRKPKWLKKLPVERSAEVAGAEKAEAAAAAERSRGARMSKRRNR